MLSSLPSAANLEAFVAAAQRPARSSAWPSPGADRWGCCGRCGCSGRCGGAAGTGEAPRRRTGKWPWRTGSEHGMAGQSWPSWRGDPKGGGGGLFAFRPKNVMLLFNTNKRVSLKRDMHLLLPFGLLCDALLRSYLWGVHLGSALEQLRFKL